jgi:hypothetical protein
MAAFTYVNLRINWRIRSTVSIYAVIRPVGVSQVRISGSGSERFTMSNDGRSLAITIMSWRNSVSVSNRELLRLRLKKGVRELLRPRLKHGVRTQQRKLLKSNDDRNSANKHQKRRDDLQGKGGNKKRKRKQQPKSKPVSRVVRVVVVAAGAAAVVVNHVKAQVEG